MFRAVLLLAAGCYATGPTAHPTRYESMGCHVEILSAKPKDDAGWVARVRVFADLRRVDEDWAREALMRQSCSYGANALVMATDVEAIPPRLAADFTGEWTTFEADVFVIGQ